jgi:glycosyltransferase involved in cell wall biosynthesis
MWILAKYLSTAPKNHKAFLHILDPQFEGNDLFDYRDRVLSLEFSKDVLDRIVFSNFRSDQPATDNDVAEMIQMSDLIVSASIGEGFGLIMAEAMACAKPIIHNEYTTPKELIADTSMGIGPRGWIVPTNNTFVASLNTEHAYSDRDTFVRMLHQVVTDRQEMFTRGQNGRLFAEKYLNWDYLAEEWKKIFREVI